MSKKSKEIFNAFLDEASEICILGHISPDGDCVGSVLSIKNYINTVYPEKRADVYLEEKPHKFEYLSGYDSIITDCAVQKSYDLCIVCDCGSADRLGKFLKYLKAAKKSFLVDHHVTNQGFCNEFVIEPEASSTSEIVFTLLSEEYIKTAVAECIYTGIIHDTGVFKYNTTSSRTMEIAGKCMDKGIAYSSIIDDSFYAMSFDVRRLLGYTLTHLEARLSGRFNIAVLSTKEMREFGIMNSRETDGFIESIRNITGAAGGAFFYQIPDGHYKASLRSNTDSLDVAQIALSLGGGGHKRAAGCLLSENYRADIEKIVEMVREQLDKE